MLNTIIFLLKFALVLFAFGYALPRTKAFQPSVVASSHQHHTSQTSIMMASTATPVDEVVGGASVDFSGKWSREFSLCSGLAQGLEQRGLSPEEAQAEAEKPYIQSWSRDEPDSTSWKVTTYQTDGVTARRCLTYQPGEWEETYIGKATLFGASDKEVLLKRTTSYVEEADASPIQLAQLTITDGPKGIEESLRYLRGDKLILKRTLHPKDESQPPAVSTEVFSRCT